MSKIPLTTVNDFGERCWTQYGLIRIKETLAESRGEMLNSALRESLTPNEKNPTHYIMSDFMSVAVTHYGIIVVYGEGVKVVTRISDPKPLWADLRSLWYKLRLSHIGQSHPQAQALSTSQG